jgi:hypothetical protein
MKKLLLYFALAYAMSFNVAEAQKRTLVDYLDQLPKDLILDNSIIRSYQITTDLMDYDLKGNFIRKTSVTGEYTYGLNGDSIRWNNVFVSQVNDSGKVFRVRQNNMENLTYIPSAKIVNKKFFKNIPDDNFLMKNLVWDVFGIEGFAYWYWDSLKLNHVFNANALNTVANLAGSGSFENKDAKINWIGITKINNEICAIIKYSTMNNLVKVDLENLTMSGRSHYWGEIYVSLEDKQIEYATLTEDVITDILIKGQPKNFMGYTVRYITLLKIK